MLIALIMKQMMMLLSSMSQKKENHLLCLFHVKETSYAKQSLTPFAVCCDSF